MPKSVKLMELSGMILNLINPNRLLLTTSQIEMQMIMMTPLVHIFFKYIMIKKILSGWRRLSPLSRFNTFLEFVDNP